MTNYPHRTLNTATHREKPAGKDEYGSGHMLPENESLKNTDIFTRLFHKKSCINSTVEFIATVSCKAKCDRNE